MLGTYVGVRSRTNRYAAILDWAEGEEGTACLEVSQTRSMNQTRA